MWLEEMKLQAKEQIRGKIGKLFCVSLIVTCISVLANLVGGFIPFFPLVIDIVITPGLSLGIIMIYLTVCEGKDFSVMDVFKGYDNFWGAFKVSFLVGLFTFLWSLLFIIPGIIKSYSYSMAMYIMAEEGCGAREAIKKSEQIMDGNKMELFLLELSFIGWVLLGIITFGIAYIYVTPYMNAARVNFYNSIKEPVRLYADVADGDSSSEGSN